jgi:hypothetical protein
VEWSGSLLNNTGDQVNLITSTGQQLESLDLLPCKSGYSYARFNQEWELTDTPTPGASNQRQLNPDQSSSDSSTQSSSIKETQSATPLESATLSAIAATTPSTSGPYPGVLPLLSQLGQVLGAMSDTLFSPQIPSLAENIASLPPRSLKIAGLSAIIGGLCLTAVGSYSLYEAVNNKTIHLD